ncbi:MAG TPA: hypothetical protein VIZ65_12510 [Cellvibrionaceae bacterium]
MKLITWFLFAAVCFPVITLAQAPSVSSPGAQSAKKDDLAAKLLDERNTLKKLVESERGTTLMHTADIIAGSGLSDAELYAAVESKTKMLVAEHKADPKNDVVANELNDMMRAMGSMNVNSKDLVSSLIDGASSRGVRERALRLVPKLSWYEHRNRVMQNPEFYEPGQDLMSHRYINLLLSEDPTFGRWALEELTRREGAKDSIVYKKMNEILQAQKTNIKSDDHLDFLAWICKTLRRYDVANSAVVLNSISNDTSKDKNMRKLKKYVKI